MEGFRFSHEALEYEQEKQERLLREAARDVFEMSGAESEQFLDDMGQYRQELEDIVREKKSKLNSIKENKLKRTKNRQAILTLSDEIEELEEQIADLSDFEEAGKDAEEFTVK